LIGLVDEDSEDNIVEEIVVCEFTVEDLFESSSPKILLM